MFGYEIRQTGIARRSKEETLRREKLYLYLTRKAKRREEQSRSRQEELQRNWASYGGLSPQWEQR